MHIRGWVLAGLAVALPTQAMAEAAAPACLTPAEVQNVVAFALPTAVAIADGICGKVLPPEAGFSQNAQALQKQYQPASDAAWPATRATLLKIMGPSSNKNDTNDVFSALLASNDPTTVRTMAVAMLSGTHASPTTCAMVGRVLPLLKPMPPENMAGLFEVVIEAIVNEHKPGARPPRFQICTTPPAQP